MQFREQVPGLHQILLGRLVTYHFLIQKVPIPVMLVHWAALYLSEAQKLMVVTAIMFKLR